MSNKEKFNPMTILENSIEVKNPSNEEYKIIQHCILEKRTNTEEYKRRIDAGAFLQCDYDNYLLIEFWTHEHSKIEAFINMIDRKFKEKKEN